MKSWLLYFFAIIIIIFSVALASNYIYADYQSPYLRLMDKDKLTHVTAEEYALGVLLAESQGCTDFESQKALAIAARSVALYLAAVGCNHTDFDACTDGSCCIALGNKEDVTQEVYHQCKRAVDETKGVALFYNNLPALALFCQCTGDGSAQSPQYTYLTAVKNPNGCQAHVSRQTHPYTALTPLLLKETDYETASQSSVLVYGENGNCDFGIIAGKLLTSAQIRGALSLCSPQFSLTFDGDCIQSHTVGLGHGYGMSICHSNQMAQSGWSYQRILRHFYPSLTLKKLYNN